MADDEFEPIQFAIDRQLEPEINETSTIEALIQNAPEWKAEYASELALLVRQHMVLQSAIGFAIELANNATGLLRNYELSKKEFRFQQGRVNGLETYVNGLVGLMQAAEAPAQPEEDEDESDD